MFGTAFMWRCASAGMPQGGPKDSLPPVVIAASPAFSTTNFSGKRIYIGFDEYVQLKDQQKEIYTSPKMKKNPLFTIRGKGIQIDIQDTLLENTTYAINFGSSVRDNNEGNPLNGLRYVFSTGDQIDSMFMSGYTVNAFTRDSASKTLIYFFDPAIDTIPEYDSLLFKATPLAVAKSENNGIFVAQNLKPMPYLVYALQDENGNNSYDPGTDRVAFLGGTFNPADLPEFNVWFDTTRNYYTAQPQLYFRLFMDEAFKRQNLSNSTRPIQHKLMFEFSAPFPQIESIRIDSIDSTRLVWEYPTPKHDTLLVWLNERGENLPDTIRGSITYLKHDSLTQLVSHSEDFKLFWKYFESKEEKKAREAEEKKKAEAEEAGEEYIPPVVPNPFQYSSTGKGELNPQQNVAFKFDYPLTAIDSSQIRLLRLVPQVTEGSTSRAGRKAAPVQQTPAPTDDKQPSAPVGEPVKFRLRQDSLDAHRWIISADWKVGDNYQLLVPAGVFTNVAYEQNDSIDNKFSILDPEKYAFLSVNVKGKTPQSKYILQLLNKDGKMLQQKQGVTTGKYTFSYIDPGEVKLKVIEDMNGNNQWDGGSLVERRQPERTELYTSAIGDELLIMKVNWEIEIDVDMNELFAPITMEQVVRSIERNEQVRLKRLQEERAKREAEQAKQKNGSQNNSGSIGVGSALSGARGAISR